MSKVRTKTLPVYELTEVEGFFCLLRDGRYLMTPAGSPYRHPNKDLMDAILHEWQAQGDTICPNTMPMTQLFATACDIVGKDRQKTANGLLAYVATDLLCHWVKSPDKLALIQSEHWQPYLDWCKAAFGVTFHVCHGIIPADQDNETREAMLEAIEKLDNFALAGLSSAVDCSGSLVLGLALTYGKSCAKDIFQACELDVLDQSERWGSDPVTEARNAAILKELEACEKWFEVIKR
ncbi:MAG: ATP12 family protein [Alphaproteobacteria bacterium]|jgi:chaperone required for assembly of F1-ATPase|nr:ATP12 family protein [Alphaproteobacteria bacterium]